MQLGQEELRDGVGMVGMGVGAAGHLQPVERIDGGHAIAERHKDARKGVLAAGQRAGWAKGQADGAQRAMIEGHTLAARQRVGDIGCAARHPAQQIMEQRNVHRHCKGGARHGGATLGHERGGDVQRVQCLGALPIAQHGLGQCGDDAHIRIRHR